ncbi:MAG: tetratricopeptide repeat protein, partial [Bacteroidota bacterium]
MDQELLLQQANQLLNEEEFQQAVPLLLKVVAQLKDNAKWETQFNAYYNLGFSYLALEEYEKALPYFQYTLQLELPIAYKWLPHQGLANALLSLHRAEEAIPHFEQAIERCHEARPKVYMIMDNADAYFEIKQVEKAIEQLEQAMSICEKEQLEEDTWTVGHQLSDWYLSFRPSQQAVELLEYLHERAKKYKASDWEILFLGNLSTAYLYNGQIEAS